MSVNPTNRPRSKRPCAPTDGQSADRLDKLYDAWDQMGPKEQEAEILRSHPEGAAAVFLPQYITS